VGFHKGACRWIVQYRRIRDGETHATLANGCTHFAIRLIQIDLRIRRVGNTIIPGAHCVWHMDGAAQAREHDAGRGERAALRTGAGRGHGKVFGSIKPYVFDLVFPYPFPQCVGSVATGGTSGGGRRDAP